MIMTQEEFLNQILNLKQSNPSMDIHFCMDSENAYEYGWVQHQITEVKICPWYVVGEQILIDETDIKLSIEEDIDERAYRIPGEVMGMVIERYSKIKKAICVFTAAT
jgi:hypothetical protein